MAKLVILFLVLLPYVSVGDNRNNELVEMWNNFLHHPSRTIDNMFHHNDAHDKHKRDCPGCLHGPKVNELRLKFVQNQILRKLRMSSKPSVSSTKVPTPIAAGATMLRSHSQEDSNEDDFYGKTEQKILFASEDNPNGQCEGIQHHPSACISFGIPKDVELQMIDSAELWFYKLPDPLDGYKQTFVITEAAHWDRNHLHVKSKPVAIHDTDISEGWIKVKVGWAVNGWVDEEKASLSVSCRSCGNSPELSPIDLKKPENRPFLVLNNRNGAKKRRSRSLECTPGMTECCREKLEVNFSSIDWDDFIVLPKSYNAYFCRGSCSSVAAVTLSGSNHNSMIKKLLHTGSSNRMELKPCCAPTSFSSLEVLHKDTSGGSESVSKKLLPNMVVEACGCM